MKQAVGLGKWMLVLVRPDAASPPETLFVFHDHEIVFVVHYLSYETLDGDDMSVFQRPKDINFTQPPTN